ncbi:hypothetical protein GUITHDRAFT_99732 [Guillardia theta CCMP2712]|uniref:Uncharacterized protein n=2 Tax=Guillardia theta TaxID=55529 RepID=L1K3Q6_GUITC|nr:hypothetical protein GUITHDRAFT_99732 [Guillardia theta CCMP2712]EKX55100.1 hypothetical protein GUITHDRAFT_99732 [Guillardia theta CCMP2712]|mmetsp:Transcript_43360/g.137085  ORF Transcript_43360/g.137085 Transcript_43360/m.137085 type:complete len:147 (+) Transcript_43360:959-1399(+)|eukprot:XP_005842080.1 hypothetical protein GUITHDRAFT_99732 [Guillardia theta CCMP2712]
MLNEFTYSRYKMNNCECHSILQDRVQELLQFIDELKRLAKFLGLGNHGLVFQELLGLSNSGNKKEESIITGLVKLDQYLEPDRIAQLCRHVDDLRMLLRLKVQDGSDLQTAAKTLRDSYHFFVSLQRHAEEKGTTCYEFLEQLRQF